MKTAEVDTATTISGLILVRVIVHGFRGYFSPRNITNFPSREI